MRNPIFSYFLEVITARHVALEPIREGYSEVQSIMSRFSTMPDMNRCKVINIIHNHHFSTHFNKYRPKPNNIIFSST